MTESDVITIERTFEMPPMPAELQAKLDEKADEDDAYGGFTVGDIVEAEVVEVSPDALYLKLSDDTIGRCPTDDARPIGEELSLQSGDKVRVLLDSPIDDERWLVSIGKVGHLEAWNEWQERSKTHAAVEGTVRVVVKGGFSVEAEGIQCFVPGRESGIRFHNAFDAIGQKFTFETIRFDERRGQPVLGRSNIARKEAAAVQEATLAALEVGTKVVGRVTGIRPFGAFVDIGGAEGLLHVSEMSMERVEDPRQLVSVGDEIEVQIVEVDLKRNRIGLSRRELDASRVAGKYAEFEVDQVVNGTVKKLADFGAFIEIGEGVEGLCHVSELSWTERPNHPSEILEVGAAVQVRILKVDADARRLSLSLRAVEADPWRDFITKNEPGSQVSGAITRIEDYGIFVAVAEGIEGLCHVSDLTWEGRPDTPKDAGDFAVGQTIDVKVLSADLDRRRVSLGIKQLDGDPWDEAGDSIKVGAIITGQVTRFSENAAYVKVADKLEGRMHISEISTERIDSLRSVLRIGQDVEVMVKQADRDRRRLDLSIKAIAEQQERDTPKSFEDEAVMNPLAAAFMKTGLVDDDEKSD